MRKHFLIIILIVSAILFISGCSANQNSTSLPNSHQNSENETKIVLNDYLKYNQYTSWKENSYNLNKQIQLSGGNFKLYLEKEKEIVDLMADFFANFSSECKLGSSEAVCFNMENQLKENGGKHFRKEEIKSVNFVVLDNGLVRLDVTRNLEDETSSTFNEIKFVFNKTPNGWKIIDSIDERGESLNLNLIEDLANLEKQASWFKYSFNKIFDITKKAKNDKCWLIQYNNKLTQTELEKEINDCYFGKYTTVAWQNGDTTICNEITGYSGQTGNCYGAAAVKKNDLSICANMLSESYEAKGYNYNLSSKDVCFSYMSMGGTALEKSRRENACNQILNKQLRTQCLTNLGILENEQASAQPIVNREESTSYSTTTTSYQAPTKTCSDECSNDRCSGSYLYKCLTSSDGCKDEESRGIVKGECGVVCITDDDCTATKQGVLRPIKTEKCSLYACKSRGCAIWDEEVKQMKEKINQLINSGTSSSEEVNSLQTQILSRSCFD